MLLCTKFLRDTHPPPPCYLVTKYYIIYLSEITSRNASTPYFDVFGDKFQDFRGLVLYTYHTIFIPKWKLRQEPVPVGRALLFLFFYPDFLKCKGLMQYMLKIQIISFVLYSTILQYSTTPPTQIGIHAIFLRVDPPPPYEAPDITFSC